MKVTVPLVLVLILAAAFGYLLGTESGRERRDVILVKLGRMQDETGSEPTEAADAE